MKYVHILLFLALTSISTCNALVIETALPFLQITVTQYGNLIYDGPLAGEEHREFVTDDLHACDIFIHFFSTNLLQRPYLMSTAGLYSEDNIDFRFDGNGNARLTMNHVPSQCHVSFGILYGQFAIKISRAA